MTQIIRSYLDRNSMKIGKRDMNVNGFRALHTDFINNDEKQGYRITFDNTLHIEPPQREMTAGEFIEFLFGEYQIIHKPSTLERFRTLLRL